MAFCHKISFFWKITVYQNFSLMVNKKAITQNLSFLCQLRLHNISPTFSHLSFIWGISRRDSLVVIKYAFKIMSGLNIFSEIYENLFNSLMTDVLIDDPFDFKSKLGTSVMKELNNLVVLKKFLQTVVGLDVVQVLWYLQSWT